MMRRVSLSAPSLAVALSLCATACAGPKYVVQTSETESPVLSGQCALRVLSDATAPTGYTLLGTVTATDPTKLSDVESEFLEAVRAKACKVGANAVIAHRDESGRYLRGTIVRLR